MRLMNRAPLLSVLVAMLSGCIAATQPTPSSTGNNGQPITGGDSPAQQQPMPAPSMSNAIATGGVELTVDGINLASVSQQSYRAGLLEDENWSQVRVEQNPQAPMTGQNFSISLTFDPKKKLEEGISFTDVDPRTFSIRVDGSSGGNRYYLNPAEPTDVSELSFNKNGDRLQGSLKFSIMENAEAKPAILKVDLPLTKL